MKNALRIVFMGTPVFARVLLQGLAENPAFEIVAIFAQPDKPAFRGQKTVSPPVAEFAKAKNLRFFQPETLKDESIRNELKNLAPDFLVVAAYGKILGQSILEIPRIAPINVHASLLPKYRGAAPIQHALLNGDKETGVAIMHMVPKLDAGPVYDSIKIQIDDDDTTESLTRKLAELGNGILQKSLLEIAAGKLSAVPQDESKMSLAPKISKDMAKINWQNSALKILGQIRGLHPWPVAETFFSGKRILMHQAKIFAGSSPKPPGTLLALDKSGWRIACGDGILLIEEVQLEGRKRSPAFDVGNGLRLAVNDVLC